MVHQLTIKGEKKHCLGTLNNRLHIAWEKCNLIARTYEKSIIESKAKFFNVGLVGTLDNKPKTFHEVINLKTDKPVQLISGDCLPSPDEQNANRLSHYFRSVFMAYITTTTCLIFKICPIHP